MTDSPLPGSPSGPTSPAGAAGSGDAPVAETSAQAKRPVWLVRSIVGVIIAIVLVIAYLIASVTVPLMWANSIRDQIGGQLGNSIPLGMFYGFVFTFVPVLVAWQAHRKHFNKWVRVSLVVLGLLLTLPNLLTLSVLYGGTQTSADARSIWANSANWFGTWSQIFMLVGLVCSIAVIVFGRMWIKRGRKIREIQQAEKIVRDHEREKERAAERAAKAAAKEAARAQRKQP